ncbi:hypothetical protein I4F81_005502 [Pyropia yezoensis]|uniref:Uncharacterized protein n=1 Tax=Pyropia yezoensis TaxID=2788 RepID=A0ACC3BY21_PYRYE|nr:hypothetical protein I4F81_005502 [Neopyropia yezoensis]
MAASPPAFLPPPPAAVAGRIGGGPRRHAAAAIPTGGGAAALPPRRRGSGGVLRHRWQWAPAAGRRRGGGVPAMAAAADGPSTPPPVDVDAMFARLGHKNEVMRKRASLAIADNRTPDTIDRLMALLPLEDVAHRRAAVQSLGMIGMDAVPALAAALSTSADPTVRASAVKGLAAVALYFPARRATFPDAAMDAMEATLNGSPDPVTKLATVGALGTLGSPVKGGGGGERNSDGNGGDGDDDDGTVYPGNARAVAYLVRISGETTDLGVAAVVVGALASIGASGEREAVLPALRALAEKPGEDGSEFIREMAATHADNLASGSWAGGGGEAD